MSKEESQPGVGWALRARGLGTQPRWQAAEAPSPGPNKDAENSEPGSGRSQSWPSPHLVEQAHSCHFVPVPDSILLRCPVMESHSPLLPCPCLLKPNYKAVSAWSQGWKNRSVQDHLSLCSPAPNNALCRTWHFLFTFAD